jgi:pantetheine-phosphate adenylyltransferase
LSPGGASAVGPVALCPGTFDPITNGHLDIIRRASAAFGQAVIAVLENPGKAPLFPVEERVSMLKEAVGDLDNVEIASFSGLLVDYARQRGIGTIVKGIRAVSDFDYELQMAQMNYRMAGVETFFLPTSPQWSYLSSSLVKEVVRFGGDVRGLVPEFVRERLEERLGPRKE